MELRHLRYFMVVAEEQSFSRAARRLGISQPPLSMQIKALEAEIGTELFYRSSQGAELTPAGQAFLAELYPIQQQIRQAVQHAQNIANGEVGELRLGFTGTSMLNPLVTEAIRQFRRQYPKIPLKLKEANSLLLIEQVEQDQLDIAILRPPKQPAADLTIQLLQQEQLVAALPVDYPVSGDCIHLSELAAESFIVSPYEISSGLYDAIVGACHKAGFEPIFGPQAPQIVSILSLVSANLGVTLVPESTQQLNIRGIKYVQLQDSPAHVGLALAHKQNYHSQTAINFASIVHTVLNQQKML